MTIRQAKCHRYILCEKLRSGKIMLLFKINETQMVKTGNMCMFNTYIF